MSTIEYETLDDTLGNAGDSLGTPKDVLALHDQALYELVDGELVAKVLDMKSSEIIGLLGFHLIRWRLSIHANHHVLPEQSFKCFPHKPGQVRRPDLALILEHRVPADTPEDGHTLIVPDLAVEVVSEQDHADDIDDKLMDYKTAGVPLVWLIYRRSRRIVVVRGGRVSGDLLEDDMLSDPILPGFSVRVGDLFPSTS
jgi:Uma2 family endonuclease